MDKKRILCYMFACIPEPGIVIIKVGENTLSDYMQAVNWKCLGSVELTPDQFEALRYFFEEVEYDRRI